MIGHKRLSVLLALVVFLTGCASLSRDKNDIFANKERQLDEGFSFANLETGAQSNFEAASNSSFGFNRLIVQYERQFTDNAGRQVGSQVKQTMIAEQSGVVRSLFEESKNGILSSLDFVSSYRGIYSLREQTVHAKDDQASIAWGFRELHALDSATEKAIERGQFLMSARMASAVGDVEVKMVCAKGDSYSAKEIAPTLEGEALNLDCAEYHDVPQFAKIKLMYLKNYGVALDGEEETTAGKAVYKVGSVSVE